jgi:hypothetical protein
MKSLVVFLALAASGISEPRRLSQHAFGPAWFTWDGSAFYMADGDERLVRFDAQGKPTGSVPLQPANELGQLVSKRARSAHAVSPDGKWLVLSAQLDGGGYGALLLDSKSGAARALETSNVMLMADWLGDGRIAGSSFVEDMGPVAWIVDPRIDLHPRLFCASLSARVVHAHPDGKRLGVAGDALFIADGSCQVEAKLSLPDTLPTDFAFSPSGMRVAVSLAERPKLGRLTPLHLVVWSLDGKERVDTPILPEDGGPLVWLDEETVIYPARNGPVGTSQRTLRRYNLRTRADAPLITPNEHCEDSGASVPPRGGWLIFQRLCDDEKQSGIFRVDAK